MSSLIWKWQLPLTERFELPLPEGAQILCVQLQPDGPSGYPTPFLWAMFSRLEAPFERKYQTRRFLTSTTGNATPSPVTRHDYLGTVQINGIVLHYFEEAGGIRRDLDAQGTETAPQLGE